MARKLHPIRTWRLPEEAPVTAGQAAQAEAALDAALVRQLGALPLLLPLVETLGLREIVNRHCHPDGLIPEDVDVGLVVLVLVLNRLQAPQPLVHVEEWIRDSALVDLLALQPE